MDHRINIRGMMSVGMIVSMAVLIACSDAEKLDHYEAAEIVAEFSTTPDLHSDDNSHHSLSHKALSQESCEILWANFTPYSTAELPYKIKRRIQKMKHGVPHLYYPTPFDFDHDGEGDIILIDNIGYSQILGGQGSHIIIVKIANFDSNVAIEDLLLSNEIDVESLFMSNLIHASAIFERWHEESTKLLHPNSTVIPTRRFRLESDIQSLPQLNSGRVQFGQIDKQVVLKINADVYGVSPPKDFDPNNYIRPYDLLAQFETPESLRILCINKITD